METGFWRDYGDYAKTKLLGGLFNVTWGIYGNGKSKRERPCSLVSLVVMTRTIRSPALVRGILLATALVISLIIVV